MAIFTRAGIERIMRFSFALAWSRPRKRRNVVTRSDAQRFGMVLWDEIAREAAADFREVRWDRMLVDAMTVRQMRAPASLGVVRGDNTKAKATV